MQEEIRRAETWGGCRDNGAVQAGGCEPFEEFVLLASALVELSRVALEEWQYE